MFSAVGCLPNKLSVRLSARTPVTPSPSVVSRFPLTFVSIVALHFPLPRRITESRLRFAFALRSPAPSCLRLNASPDLPQVGHSCGKAWHARRCAKLRPRRAGVIEPSKAACFWPRLSSPRRSRLRGTHASAGAGNVRLAHTDAMRIKQGAIADPPSVAAG